MDDKEDKAALDAPIPPSDRAEEARQEFVGADFDADEAAYVIGMDRATVLRYLRSGQMRGYRLGREWRIPRQALIDFRDRLIEEHAVRHRFALHSRARGNRSIGIACCPKCACLAIVTESQDGGCSGTCGLCYEDFWVTADDLVERGGTSAAEEGIDNSDTREERKEPGDEFDEIPF
jgi:excisionase family DNA binding protein